jgi:ribosomal protein S6
MEKSRGRRLTATPQDHRPAGAAQAVATRATAETEGVVTDLQEIEMHQLAKRLAKLTEGIGWEAMRYLAIGRVMEDLAKYCAVCDCQRKVKL